MSQLDECTMELYLFIYNALEFSLCIYLFIYYSLLFITEQIVVVNTIIGFKLFGS